MEVTSSIRHSMIRDCAHSGPFLHQDWEHITIELAHPPTSSELYPPITRVAYVRADNCVSTAHPRLTYHTAQQSQHACCPWSDHSEITFTSTHPTVYVALNSHATFPHPRTVHNPDHIFDTYVSTAMPFLTFSRIKSIQIVDINSLDEPLILQNSQGKSLIGGERIVWKTWENEIYDLSGPRSDWPEWAKFDGPWGEDVNQVKTTGRPPVGVVAREVMYRVLQVWSSITDHCDRYFISTIGRIGGAGGRSSQQFYTKERVCGPGPLGSSRVGNVGY